MPGTPTDPRDDYLRVEPYLPEFAEAALAWSEDTCRLAAICLRETWAGWAPGYTPKGSPLGYGDHGHGFGLFQIDDRGPYARLVAANPWASPREQAAWACEVLADARRDLVHFANRSDYDQAVLATYNAGAGAVRRALIMGWGPDRPTSGGDYGADVLRRMAWLRARAPDRFPPVAWRLA